MIYSVNFSLLDTNGLFTFGHRTINVFQGVDLTGTGIETFFQQTQTNFNLYDKAVARESKNAYTELLIQKDNDRDEAFLGFREYIVACGHRVNPAWREAATRIVNSIQRYGWSASSLGYIDETAAIKNLIGELDAKYSDDITLLNAGEWLAELKTSQQNFETTFSEKVSQPPSNIPTLKDTRPLLIGSLRSLFTMIDLQFQSTGNPVLESLINQINNVIEVSRAAARAAATRKNNKTNNEPTPPAQ